MLYSCHIIIKTMASTSKHTTKNIKGHIVPIGALAINDKWNGTSLGTELKNQNAGYFIDGLGDIDFYISKSAPVVYIPQSELVLDAYSARIFDLLGENSKSTTIIVERNTSTIEKYNELVKLATLELNLNVMPIGNQSELPQLLMALAHQEAKDQSSNPYMRETKMDLSDIQKSMINLIPGVGKKKASSLLEKIGPIEKINGASLEKLTAVVGDTTAKSIRNFFDSKEYIP